MPTTGTATANNDDNNNNSNNDNDFDNDDDDFGDFASFEEAPTAPPANIDNTNNENDDDFGDFAVFEEAASPPAAAAAATTTAPPETQEPTTQAVVNEPTTATTVNEKTDNIQTETAAAAAAIWDDPIALKAKSFFSDIFAATTKFDDISNTDIAESRDHVTVQDVLVSYTVMEGKKIRQFVFYVIFFVFVLYFIFSNLATTPLLV